jgi:hypothetical protein
MRKVVLLAFAGIRQIEHFSKICKRSVSETHQKEGD